MKRATQVAGLVAVCISVGAGADPDWPPEVLPFFEELTSKRSDWSPHDFGTEPAAADRALLERFRPRIFIGPNGIPPIDFYDTYLPNALLRGPNGRIAIEQLDRATLKRHERRFGFHVDFQGKPDPCRGDECADYRTVLYGRVFHETLRGYGAVDARSVSIAVLKYNAVFPISGLPKKISWWKAAAAEIAGNLEDWHELDIHGAVHIFVHEASGRPVAVLLAQHNHFRTLIVGADMEWPADGRVAICYAERSNEPYLCPDASEPTHHPAIGDPRKAAFLFDASGEPLEGGYDVVYGPTAGATPIQYRLKFLSDRDPLYVSWIPLGDRRRILGLLNSFSRTGPPGINMNTWPTLVDYGAIAQFWYFASGDKGGFRRLKESLEGFFNLEPGPVLEHNSERFWRTLREAAPDLVRDGQ